MSNEAKGCGEGAYGFSNNQMEHLRGYLHATGAFRAIEVTFDAADNHASNDHKRHEYVNALRLMDDLERNGLDPPDRTTAFADGVTRALCVSDRWEKLVARRTACKIPEIDRAEG